MFHSKHANEELLLLVQVAGVKNQTVQAQSLLGARWRRVLARLISVRRYCPRDRETEAAFQVLAPLLGSGPADPDVVFVQHIRGSIELLIIDNFQCDMVKPAIRTRDDNCRLPEDRDSLPPALQFGVHMR